ncbi:MAG: 8-oxo-dGTP diphosphatase [Francisellaceae bacterium]|jgi:8-oxo-dGTP diphosphatase
MATEIDKLAWVYIKDKKVLCARSEGKDTYYIPGGKRDVGENDQQALIREIKEELSVDIIAKSMEYYGTFKAQADGKPKGIMVKITCYQAEFDGILSVDSEIEEMKWLDSNGLGKCSVVVQELFSDLRQKGLIL